MWGVFITSGYRFLCMWFCLFEPLSHFRSFTQTLYMYVCTWLYPHRSPTFATWMNDCNYIFHANWGIHSGYPHSLLFSSFSCCLLVKNVKNAIVKTPMKNTVKKKCAQFIIKFGLYNIKLSSYIEIHENEYIFNYLYLLTYCSEMNGHFWLS